MKRATFSIRYRKIIPDNEGPGIKKQLHALGFTCVRGVKVGRWITVDCDDEMPREQLVRIGKELLAQRGTQVFTIKVKKVKS